MTKLQKILTTACLVAFFATHGLLIYKIVTAPTFEERERLKDVGVWVTATPFFICALSVGIHAIWITPKQK
jgi:hypothetical protein